MDHNTKSSLLLRVFAWLANTSKSLVVYRAGLVSKLKSMKDVVWSGDGRFDSMGHSAKYGVYTMFSFTIMKVVHFELVQV